MYFALVINTLSYACQLFNFHISYQDKQSIHVTINRFHRLICNTFNCDGNCLINIFDIWNTRCHKLFNNALHNTRHILHDTIPPFLPSNRRIRLPSFHSTRRINNFIYQMSIDYNSNS